MDYLESKVHLGFYYNKHFITCLIYSIYILHRMLTLLYIYYIKDR